MTKRTPHGDLIIVTVNLPEKYLDYIQELNEWGNTPSRSEYVRKAVANQIEADFKTKRYIESIVDSKDESLVRIPDMNGKITTYKVLKDD